MNPPELLEVIAKAAEEKSQILDLDGDPYLEFERPGALKKRVPLHSLPPEIGQVRQLTNLLLGNNALTSLPAEIGNLTKLTRLHLQENRLTSLPTEIGQLRELRSLVLTDNQLTSLPTHTDTYSMT